MGLAEDFRTFCSNLVTPTTTRSNIARRYGRITKQLNTDFWGIDSETQRSKYVGAYGRNTAIKDFSDLDMLFIRPDFLY